jgi:hypothetical protein
MPDALDQLQLGGFTFSGFSPPDLLPLGGHQAMTIHKLPGGARVIDTLGRDDDDISWRGTFFQNDAINVCVQLDAMRKAGSLISFTCAGQSRQVVISHFLYSIRRYPMWVEYVITLVVSQGAPTSGTSGTGAAADASSVDSAVSNDAQQANDVLSGGTPSGQGGIGHA